MDVATRGGLTAERTARRPMRMFAAAVLVVLLSGAGASIIPDYYTVSRALLVVIVMLCLIATRFAPLRAVSRDLWLTLLAGLALVSALWSSMPGQAFSMSATFVATILAGGVLATAGDTRRVLRMTALVLGVLSVCSLLMLVVAPSEAISAIGRFSGIFAWNSDLGLTAAAGFVTALVTSFGARRPLAWLALAAGQVVVLWMAQSATALAGAAAAGVIIILLAPRGAISWFVRTVLALAVAAGIVWQFGQAALSPLEALGKDATLTGRTAIWQLLLSNQPTTWFGTGVGAFWGDLNNVAPIVGALGFNPGHPHSGYIQVMQDLGWVGLVVVVLSIATTIYVLFSRRHGVEKAALVGLLALFIVANIANSYLLTPHLQLALYAFIAARARLRRDQSQCDESSVNGLHRDRYGGRSSYRRLAVKPDGV